MRPFLSTLQGLILRDLYCHGHAAQQPCCARHSRACGVRRLCRVRGQRCSQEKPGREGLLYDSWTYLHESGDVETLLLDVDYLPTWLASPLRLVTIPKASVWS